MTVKAYHVADAVPHRVDAIEPGEPPRDGARVATLGKTINLSIGGLKDFFFASWRYDLIDLPVIGAAVEYCDLSIRRPAWGWARSFDLRVAVPPVRSLGARRRALGATTGRSRNRLATVRHHVPIRKSSHVTSRNARLPAPVIGTSAFDQHAVAWPVLSRGASR